MEDIQGGDPTALVGMPLVSVCKLLRAAGMKIPKSLMNKSDLLIYHYSKIELFLIPYSFTITFVCVT